MELHLTQLLIAAKAKVVSANTRSDSCAASNAFRAALHDAAVTLGHNVDVLMALVDRGNEPLTAETCDTLISAFEVNEANSVVDRLNAVFAQSSDDVPDAKEVHRALIVLGAEVEKRVGRSQGMPAGFSPSEMVVNKEIASLVDDLRNHANRVIELHGCAKELEGSLAKALPAEVKKKLVVKI